jgi:hypothetical protein
MIRQFVRGLALLLVVAPAVPAQALEWDFGDNTIKLENLITVGGLWRMQNRDESLVGKPNVTPGLCLVRTAGGTPTGGPSINQDENSYGSGEVPAVCATSNTEAIDAFNAAPGSFSPNGDNGNLNFERGDIVHATAKVTSDLTLDLWGFNVFARGLYFFDNVYHDLEERHPDPTLTATSTKFSDAGKDAIGNGFEMLDYFVSRTFEIGDHNLAVKIGNQVINWGESAFLIPNSLNSINPPNQALLRLPGFDIKELFQPVGMGFLSFDLMEGVGVEAFYQYQWKPVVADPVGSFFSTSDTIGPGGRIAMLSFSRAAEDYGFPTDDPHYPAGYRGFYRAIDTCDIGNIEPGVQETPCVDSAGLLGSTSSRTIYRDKAEEEKRMPSDGGQYGVALKYFADWLNGGTEFGFYYANYHSRFPTVSAFAAQSTCVTDVASLVDPAGCGLLGDSLTGLLLTATPPALGRAAAREPLPVDTVRLVVEYPEDIHMAGFSFNTTVGDFALAGEYTFRDNLPIQVHTTDLIFAALQPAFPQQDVVAGVAGTPAQVTIPGRRSAVPDFLMTNYRHETVQPGQYIQGYERMKQGQVDITLLKTFGGDNWLRASQITTLLEMGHTHVFDFPEIDQLQFQGAGTDTHISSGADGSIGINPQDVRCTPVTTACTSSDTSANASAQTSRQNPHTQGDRNGFGTQDSYGYRFVALTRYDDALFGVNVEFLTGFFHDVEGVGPGIGQNFVQGRKQILGGVRFDYLSRYTGEIRYTVFTGGARRDPLRDRDNVLVWAGYQF